jgi:selT/selW/selH-like putative selenoprotein
LIPSGGGAFEVTVDGKLIWSKKKTKDFPEYSVLTEALG